MAFISFDVRQREARFKLWNILIKNFLQKFISPESRILEIGSGWGEFIDQIKAKEKFAVDIDESFRQYVDKDVVFSSQNVCSLNFKPDTFDHVFLSNVLEHLETKQSVSKAISELKRVLRPGGTLIIIQPNFKYCWKVYFDFSDHCTVWTDRSMKELLIQEGFQIDYSVDRFLPFSTKQHYPKHSFFLSLYLKMPLFWKIFGQQFLIVARK